jgi:hypothetical protein
MIAMTARSGARALLFSALALVVLAQPASAEDAPRYDWVLHYYMAYDNNLERCGRPIIDMLRKGITSDRVAVVVSADFRDTKGMHRYVLTQSGEKSERLSEEGSAEEETVAAELAWVGRHFPARRYGLVFLNHGGALGQMSYDEHPGRAGGQNWLYPPDVAKVITRWRTRIKKRGGEVELMFFQQCGKGSLENDHAMRNAARYVMGSQTLVGAPNYYYTPAIRELCQRPRKIDGKGLAKLFTRHETPNMFTTYTTVSSAKAKQLAAHLDPVLEPLVRKGDQLALPPRRSLPSCFDAGSEPFFDLLALLKGLYRANGLEERGLERFTRWVQKELIVEHRVSPQRKARAGGWSGLSLMLPTRRALLVRYADYPIYRDTRLGKLFAGVVASLERKRGARVSAQR